MTTPRYGSIKRMIFGCMLIAPLVPFTLILVIGFFYFDASLEATTRATNVRIVADHGRMIDSFLRERKNDLNFILQPHTFAQISAPDTLTRLFLLLRGESNAFVDIGILNESGDHVAYHGPFPLEGKNYRTAPWFTQVMEKGVYISDVFLGYRQIPHFIIALMRTFGSKKWIVRATIDTQFFNELVEAVRIGRTGEAFLTNLDGLLQTQRRSTGHLMEKVPGFPGDLPMTGEVKTAIGRGASRDNFIYAATRLKEKNWILVVRQERADAFQALHAAGYRIVLIALIGGALIAGAALFLSGYIVKKMEKTDLEKGELGRQLARAGRLAELGEMSAGFAHEINNPLQIMKSELALIRLVRNDILQTQGLGDDENTRQVADCLDQIQQQIDRCAQITQGILQFARQSEPVSQRIDPRAFIPAVVRMISKQAQVNNIAIDQRISRDTPDIYADPGQLQQVFLNLLNNASDAIREHHGARGGRIRIEASRGNNGPGNNDPENNEWVRISVKDNGCGIREENHKKVFSPFFTTKPVGRGTGLGLSVCYGIIENMGGTMDFVSTRDNGTTFTLSLVPAPRQTDLDHNRTNQPKGDEHEAPCNTIGR